jgi:hypothetical protein
MSQDWASDSDNDKFEWDTDGEAETSSAPALRNIDAPGPSTRLPQVGDRGLSLNTRASHLFKPCCYFAVIIIKMWCLFVELSEGCKWEGQRVRCFGC